MNIYPISIALLLLCAATSCAPFEATEAEQDQAIIPRGIFETYINVGKALHFDTLLQTYSFDADTSSILRYISMPLQGDFILEVQLQEKSGTGEYGLLLTTDEKGEKPIATLQMIDDKVAFGPAGLVNESSAYLLDAKYLKLERVGKRLTAYYGIATGKFKALAAQQLPFETEVYGGLFVKKNQTPVVFSNLLFTKPLATATQ